MDRLTSAQTAPEASGAVIIIQSGQGIEGATFTADLARMYLGYATRHHWEAGIRRATASDGGYQDVTLRVLGPEVYGRLKQETGTHRVQRVPGGAGDGRVHTSTARVTVLPHTGQAAPLGGVPPDTQEEKIRTYNVPRDRVTDHRINLTLHSLPHILDGDLDALLDALEGNDQ
jgi:peptide chain release factor 1